MSMSPSETRRFLALGDTPVPEVQVRNWPLVDGGWRSVIVIVLIVITIVGAAQISHSLPMGLLAGVAIVAAMYRFWLPARYSLRSRGVEEHFAGRVTRVPWRNVRSCEIKSRGVLLRLQRSDVGMGRDVAFFIEWHDQREDVLEAIDFYCRTSVMVSRGP
jgi:hypothetical protein